MASNKGMEQTVLMGSTVEPVASLAGIDLAHDKAVKLTAAHPDVSINSEPVLIRGKLK